MAVDYPKQLPKPIISNYRYSPIESVIRSEMDSGIARQRRRFTSVPIMLKLRWIFTQNQFARFESWYKSEAADGALWITQDLLTGSGVAGQESRFITPFVAQLLSHNTWEVNADMEIRNIKVVDLTESDILDEGIDVSEFCSLQNDLHKLIHVDLSTTNKW